MAFRLRLSKQPGKAPGSVCAALADCVAAGEIESFREQLPLEMKDLFPPTPLRRSA